MIHAEKLSNAATPFAASYIVALYTIIPKTANINIAVASNNQFVNQYTEEGRPITAHKNEHERRIIELTWGKGT